MKDNSQFRTFLYTLSSVNYVEEKSAVLSSRLKHKAQKCGSLLRVYGHRGASSDPAGDVTSEAYHECADHRGGGGGDSTTLCGCVHDRY